MPARFDRAVDFTGAALVLAWVPVVASLLSVTKIARILNAGPGGGIAFPLPTGLPTLWTYVSMPNGPGPGPVGGPLSVVAFVPLFLVGLLVTSALEAGFLGALWDRIGDDPGGFVANVERFTLRMLGVNLLRAAIVFAAVPLLVVPPLAIVVLLAAMYLLYGLPFEIVVRDDSFTSALDTTVSHALDGGSYVAFGGAHLVAGAVASVVLSLLVRNGGLAGILVGALVVAVPAVFVANYGLLVFHELNTTGPRPAGY